jgi:hypothetical protein
LLPTVLYETAIPVSDLIFLMHGYPGPEEFPLSLPWNTFSILQNKYDAYAKSCRLIIIYIWCRKSIGQEPRAEGPPVEGS